MSHDEDTISKLLRLKRYEQPPPEYFEKFLHEFHRRQRVELLQRSTWRVMLDRLEVILSPLSFGQLSYAGASLAVLAIAGVITVNMIEHPGVSAPSFALQRPDRSMVTGALAANSPSREGLQDVQPVRMAQASSYAVHEFTLAPRIQFPDAFQNQAVQSGATRLQPRYILDPRPASYEPPFSF